MSQTDKALLKRARLSQAEVGDLLDVSQQAVSYGLAGTMNYLNSERLSKLIDALETKQPHKAALLREELQRVIDEEAAGDDAESPRFYLRRHSLVDVLARVKGPVIWLPLDPLRRIAQEAGTLQDVLPQRVGDVTLLVDADAEHASEMLRGRIALDYQRRWSSTLTVIEQMDAMVRPELVVGMSKAFVRTGYGFHEAADEDAACMLKTLYRCSRLSPDHIPLALGKGYRQVLFVAAEPKERIGAELIRRLLDDSEDDPARRPLVQHLKAVLPTLAIPPATAAPIQFMLRAVPTALPAEVGDDGRDLVRAYLEEMLLQDITKP